MQGAVGSDDLPRSISRETLRHNRILRATKKILVRKCLEMFADITESKDGANPSYDQCEKKLKLGDL